MKIVLKGGCSKKNNEIEKFFMNKIFPILSFGIAIEPTNVVITVYKKQHNGIVDSYIDPTAEVIVELDEEAINLAKDGGDHHDIAEQLLLEQLSGNFFDEALAIKEIEKLKPSFSVEYYSCRYTPPNS